MATVAPKGLTRLNAICISAGLIALGLLLAAACPEPVMAIDGAGIRSFLVESEPAGAEVITITGSHGTTPVTLTERDLYPNSYPPERMARYGTLTLRKSGCREMNIRPGDSDIVRGLSLALDCGPEAAVGSAGPPGPARRQATAQQRAFEPAPSPADDGAAARKLRQLRFLQELLDDGLISAEEEAVIRQRILRQP